MAKDVGSPDFEGKVTYCEIMRCGDRNSETRFNIKGVSQGLRACYASIRLNVGEHIRAYGSRDYLRRIEVVVDDSVVFMWRDYQN